MRLTLGTAILAILCLLIDTDQAFAWGPATHVGFATSVLERLGVLPAAIAAILGRHGLAFLYGNVAADIVFAKRLSRVKQFCHHWSTAFGLLGAARDDRARAFAYGYLSHLAADTVAHGKYVPRQIVMSECSVNFGHFVWELRAEAMAAEAHRRRLEWVLENDHGHHHTALEGHMTGTFLPYDLNRLLFGGISALTARRGFRLSVDVWNRCSRWYLPPELLSDYRTECIDRIESILTEGSRSALLREDPNGTSTFMNLRVHRRDVRRRRRRGLPIDNRVSEVSHSLAPRLVRAAKSFTPLTAPAPVRESDLVGVALRQ